MDETTSLTATEQTSPDASNTGEWDIDVAEILDDVDMTDEEPFTNAEADQPGDVGESFTLKHLDEVKNVSRDEVVTLAQKGLDYDRIRTKLDHLTGPPNDGSRAAQRRSAETTAFLAEFPEVAESLRLKRETIPDEVWAKVRAGERLVDAYGAHRLKRDAEENKQELKRLRAELDATKQEGKNKKRSTGSVSTDGGDKPRDPILSGWNSI